MELCCYESVFFVDENCTLVVTSWRHESGAHKEKAGRKQIQVVRTRFSQTSNCRELRTRLTATRKHSYAVTFIELEALN